MKLKELIYGISDLAIIGAGNPAITGLALDSRKVDSGFLFAAIPGTKVDGHNFIAGAIQAGALAILCNKLPDRTSESVSYLVVPDVSEALGEICSCFYNHPDKDLDIIGITGTNGKTSIATWLYDLGGKLGFPCGLISTIRVMIRENIYPASHTTPDIISLYHYLHLMVVNGCQYVFMEVSSHALDQKRTAGLSFTGAVFTNISRDHLDYHENLSAYIRTKKLLFDTLDNKAFALVNMDDRNAEVMIQNCKARDIRFSARTITDYHVKIIEQISLAMLLQINGEDIWVPFIGKFNASNLVAVYGVARELAWEIEEVLTGMSSLSQVDGRFERFDLGDNVTGIVDYAHTPDALENVLETIRDMCSPGQKIITVIGAGGDRDSGKRPKMSATACRISDIVILTSDNPRSESPQKIIEDMKAGIPSDMESQVFSISDRREAIKLALAMSGSGDFILIAGKGHENYQEIKGERYHFDDREELMKMKDLTSKKR